MDIMAVVTSIALVVYGVWLIYPPAAFICLGVAVFAVYLVREVGYVPTPRDPDTSEPDPPSGD
jgi:hypothetical protein